MYYSSIRPYDRVGQVLGMAAETVRQVVHHDSSSCSSLLSVPPATRDFDNFTVGAIRRFIHCKFLSKEYFRVGSLAMDLKTAAIIPENVSVTSILRLMQSMEFHYNIAQRKMYVRKECLSVVCRRITALRVLRRRREEGRQMVYVDETGSQHGCLTTGSGLTPHRLP